MSIAEKARFCYNGRKPTPMPKPTPPPPARPAIPTGRELYDMLMAHIEPELTTEGRKKLAETYANETPENKAKRMKRYALAFERCEKSYQEYLETLDTQVARYRRDVITHAEICDRNDEDGFFNQFDVLLQSAA